MVRSIVDAIPKDKLLHFAAITVLALCAKLLFLVLDILADLRLGRWELAASVFIAVALVQLLDEYVVQPKLPGRTARDWTDAAAGFFGGFVAALLIV